MISRGVARRYAGALYLAAAEHGVADEVEKHLGAVVEQLEQQPQLKQLIENRRVPRSQRKDLLLQLAGDEAPALLKNFLQLILDKNRENLLPEFYREYYQTVLTARNIVEAEVITAVDLSDAGLESIRRRLEAVMGKEVRVLPRTDPALVGGVVVRIGDRRLDGSLKRRLAELAQAMAGKGRDQEGVAVP
ncbi:MAG TPA: ATP synthase F1 subunit delta [Sphingobacteriaceae bacterium]|nr:ATP synthase F1 subunit delta [Sphingobacteriaceae bacterium]